MSPSPFAVTLADRPRVYSWEATDEGVAERLRRPGRAGRSASTSTRRPRRRRSLAGVLAAGRFETPLSEYPPGDYRRLVEAAAARLWRRDRRDRRRAPAPTRSSTCARRRSCRRASAAVVPIPTYAMYRVLTEQRGARVVAVPRLGRAEGWAVDVAAVRAAARDADARLAVQPEQPDRRAPEPDGAIEALLDGIAGRRRRRRPARRPRRRRRRGVRASSGPIGRSRSATRFPNLVVVRTASRRTRSPASGWGSRSPRPRRSRGSRLYRPPGSVGDDLRDRRDGGPARPGGDARRTSSASSASGRGSPQRSTAVGWRPSRQRHQLHPGRPRDARARRGAPSGLLRRGLVPRTFGHGHPLAHCLRLTVREPAEDERLIAAAARSTADAAGRPGGGTRMTTPVGALDVLDAATGAGSRVARRTRETDVTIAPRPRRRGARRRRDGDRLLRPPALVARPPRPVRPRDPGDAAISTSTSTTRSRTWRSCSAARSPRRSATGPASAASGTAPCRWTSRVATAVVDVGGRPYAVIDLAVPRRAGRRRCRSSWSSTRSRPSPGPPAPRSMSAAPGATTTTWPRRRSRRSGARCGSPASRIPRRIGVASTKGTLG